jgi:short-subunit dehydrogenase
MKASKVILVTGASSGIGKESAKQLIADGHRVYVAARRLSHMTDLEATGGFPIEMDVTNEEDIAHVVAMIIAKEGKIDVLFNNAGYAVYGSVEEVPIEEARRQFEVNIFGLASLTQKVIPHMRKAGSGTIINTSSMGGKMYTPMGAWYHATKHALEGWSDCLRLELRPFNINVVILEPGAIATEFGDVMLDPMLKHSGKGPYAKLVQGIAASTREMYEKGDSSPASVISKVVSEIVQTDRPRTRYAAGKWAKLMIWIRVYLGDRIFDKVIMSQVK